MSAFEKVPLAAPDAIFGLQQEYKADPTPAKVDLVVGAYRTDDGQPYVLNTVRKAEAIVDTPGKFNKEYAPIDGVASFYQPAAQLLFGKELHAANANKIVSMQCLSGTGSLRIGMEFIKKFFPETTVYISDPTWPNHRTILDTVGIPWKYYRYYDTKSNTLDWNGLCEDLKAAPRGSVILLHACAHNPTGLDPTPEQWRDIANIIQDKKHFTFLDCAYQGFASGSLDKDAAAARLFLEKGLEMFVAQSFAKNFGLYGERIGAFHVLSASESFTAQIRSQLKMLARPGYSNPPIHGAYIVSTVLNSPELYGEWVTELKGMANRIGTMRQLLHDELAKRNVHWPHILKQIGMFGYTGLKAPQVEALKHKHHIYMTLNGRISLAGVNSKNVTLIADAIADVLNTSKM